MRPGAIFSTFHVTRGAVSATNLATVDLILDPPKCQLCIRDMLLSQEADANATMVWRCSAYRAGSSHCTGLQSVQYQQVTVLRGAPAGG